MLRKTAETNWGIAYVPSQVEGKPAKILSDLFPFLQANYPRETSSSFTLPTNWLGAEGLQFIQAYDGGTAE
jgi:hypothetical protein